MQIGCRGSHYAGLDVDDCLFTVSLRSCSVFVNTVLAVEVMQMVPWAGLFAILDYLALSDVQE